MTNSSRAQFTIAALTMAVLAIACQHDKTASDPAPQTSVSADVASPSVVAPAVNPSSASTAELTVNVGSTGFTPDSLTVRKGQPVRISFKRDNEPTCADEVVFPDLGIRKKLPANQTTVVELTPTKAGSLSFACGMDMMKGKLVVQ